MLDIAIVITELSLTNFRCFEQHRVDLRPMTVIVGRNNAGKSTLVEALRLVSVVANRYRHLTFGTPPRWSDLPKRVRGVSPSLQGFDFNVDTVFHRYGDPPAAVRAGFASGAAIDLRIGPAGSVFAVIYNRDGDVVQTKGQAGSVEISPVSILPQIGPLQENESVLVDDYVRRSLSSRLASAHFRNQLYVLGDVVDRFRQLAESTWSGLQVGTIDVIRGRLDTRLHLTVRDGDFATEVGLMGHGLQMWLQTIWFLARAPGGGAVILDEPDVYMHADLQRRLVRLIRGRYAQVIIATHSVEIMAEVAPEEVLIVDRKRRHSRFATSIPVVQQVIERLGGVHNLHLARLATSQRFILVEGDDLGILGPLHHTLFPESIDSLGAIPNAQVGGWTGWPKAVGSALVFENVGERRIRIYCLLDRDYHPAEEVDARMQEATTRGIQLHVWQRKEIENYLIVPLAIKRLVESTYAGRVRVTDIERRVAEITEDLRNATQDALANEVFARDRNRGLANANNAARALIEPRWRTPDGRLTLVSGKVVLGRLSQWTQQSFGVSFSARRLARTLEPSEIPQEIVRVLDAIEHVQPFSK